MTICRDCKHCIIDGRDEPWWCGNAPVGAPVLDVVSGDVSVNYYRCSTVRESLPSDCPDYKPRIIPRIKEWLRR